MVAALGHAVEAVPRDRIAGRQVQLGRSTLELRYVLDAVAAVIEFEQSRDYGLGLRQLRAELASHEAHLKKLTGH